jgi:hypothetical protein
MVYEVAYIADAGFPQREGVMNRSHTTERC